MGINDVFLLLLILLSVFLNGATDAVNSVASCVGTKCMKMSHATVMSAVFNCLGVIIMGRFCTSVADTFSSIAVFSDDSITKTALVSSLLSVIIWAAVTWFFGIPTSESHAMASALIGSAFAVGVDAYVDTSQAVKILYGLALSTLAGVALGFIISKLVHRYLTGAGDRLLTRTQIFGACCSSFMHGAQDGLKFAGLLMMTGLDMHMCGVAIIALVMFAGTYVGGKRIIDSVANEMVSLDKKDGLSADIGSAVCLFAGSISGGIPMSTTHTKTSALLGAGASNGGKFDLKTVSNIVAAWVITFPVCGVMSFFITKMFI